MRQGRTQALVDAFLASKLQPTENFPTTEQIQAAYQNNLNRFVIPEMVHVAQVFFTFPEKDDKKEDLALAKKVKKLSKQVRTGKVDFNAAVKEHSQHEASKQKDGSLGWVQLQQVQPALRTALKTMKNGQVSQAVKSKSGWHILKLLEHKEAMPRPLEEVKPLLVQELRKQQFSNNVSQFYTNIIKNNPITFKQINTK